MLFIKTTINYKKVLKRSVENFEVEKVFLLAEGCNLKENFI